MHVVCKAAITTNVFAFVVMAVNNAATMKNTLAFIG